MTDCFPIVTLWAKRVGKHFPEMGKRFYPVDDRNAHERKPKKIKIDYEYIKNNKCNRVGSPW
jgi:hypothetical protein